MEEMKLPFIDSELICYEQVPFKADLTVYCVLRFV